MLPPKLRQALDDLAFFTDRQERIDYLIGLAQEYVKPGSDEVPRTSQNRVPGCESEVFLTAVPLEKGLKYKIAVDNPQGISAMAMAVILDQSLSGEDPALVSQVPEDIVYEVFGKELSMGKSMGLTNMVRMVREAASHP